MNSIQFFSDYPAFTLKNKSSIREWILKVTSEEGASLQYLQFNFISDTELLNLNKQYLQHDYYTDILTFNYNMDREISGDICISIDRVKENANELGLSHSTELKRVMLHGLLHLLGFNDTAQPEKTQMKIKEDYYLRILDEIVSRETKK